LGQEAAGIQLVCAQSGALTLSGKLNTIGKQGFRPKLLNMNAKHSMQALTIDRYGDLDRFKLIEMPLSEPGAGEVRIRVRASALNPADYKVARGHMKLLHARNFPMILGYDFSGTVEAVGPGVTQIATGNDVFGFLPYSPTNRRGAFAEAVIARADGLAQKPETVSHVQAAAAATPGLTSLQALRDLGRLRTGMRVLVTGGSGGVGSLAVGIAKKLGGHVTAVASNRGLQLWREMGADDIIDRTHEDATATSKGSFDVVFDAAAAFRWRQWRNRLNKGGSYITTLPSLPFALDKLSSLLTDSRCAFVNVKSKPADLSTLAEWLSSGLDVHVDRTIPLTEVPQNLERLAQGEVLGRVVVEIGAETGR
jgi:NADPH:quinone reductase